MERALSFNRNLRISVGMAPRGVCVPCGLVSAKVSVPRIRVRVV